MVTISDMIDTVNQYFTYRGLTEPCLEESVKFFATEVGELLNVSTKLEDKWVRNNPLGAEEAKKQFANELGDCLMMLLKSIDLYGAPLEEYFVPEVNREDLENWTVEDSLRKLFLNTAELYCFVEAGVYIDDFVESLIALYTVGRLTNLDPYKCMIDKFQLKGFQLTFQA